MQLKDLFNQKIAYCAELQQLLAQEKQQRDAESEHFRASLKEIESQLDGVHADSDEKTRQI